MSSAKNLGDALKDVVTKADGVLHRLDEVREQAVKISRDVVRLSGFSITALHQGDLEAARRHLEGCEELTKKLLELTRPYPELYYSGLVYNAVSEYVEAKLLYTLVTDRALPDFEELGVYVVPYLQGLADVVGELRRYALENLRKGKLDEAWWALDLMELIYTSLRGLDYPDSILPNFRHKVDTARGLVDSTKSLVIDISQREELLRALGQKGAGRDRP